jgi:uncharacterized protein YjbJ (UPF0337 family)
MKKRRVWRIKGKAEQVVGDATGDRRVEAEGVLESRLGHKPAADEVSRAEHDMRAAHGDIADDDDR